MVVQLEILVNILWLERLSFSIWYSKIGLNYKVSWLFNLLTFSVKGVPPSPRAAHASTNVEQMQMVVYGGATGGGSLASDDLYLLDMRNGED